MFSNFLHLIFALTFFRIITYFQELLISFVIRNASIFSLSVGEKIVEKRLPATFRKALIKVISKISCHLEILRILIEFFIIVLFFHDFT